VVVTLSKGKIIPGKGFQYTPQTTIEWDGEFNELLNFYNSRNELVSKLIEDGLRVHNGSYEEKGIYLPLESFTADQLRLLKTEEGKKILYNIISLVLGNSESAAFAHQMVQPVSAETKSISRKIESSDVKTEDETKGKDNQKTQDSGDALSKLLKLGKMTNLKG
jgi:hypothetical protein